LPLPSKKDGGGAGILDSKSRVSCPTARAPGRLRGPPTPLGGRGVARGGLHTEGVRKPRGGQASFSVFVKRDKYCVLVLFTKTKNEVCPESKTPFADLKHSTQGGRAPRVLGYDEGGAPRFRSKRSWRTMVSHNSGGPSPPALKGGLVCL
jgi:hypothetical protein